ncbi:unnamed protein product [Anisakis simplex]|uniref:Lipase_3 domain-containing protein n=1 Tax=Anisakis simplex TaxID=6269 RepID=A0A0M3JX15_ANISI|nr:unnamed protein product [Anisakis simplex]
MKTLPVPAILLLCVAPLFTTAYHYCSEDTTCDQCTKEGCSYWSLSCVSDRIAQPELCPIDTKPMRFAFVDQFAREIMLPVSAAAYSKTPEKCFQHILKDIKIKRHLTLPRLASSTPEDTCSGFTAVSHQRKAIIVSFRGTTTTKQLWLEGVESVFRYKVKMPSGGEVSKYFFDATNILWQNGMMQDVFELHGNHSDYEIWVTGHSLGGAMASIAAEMIAESPKIARDQIKLVTFGQPRIGDETYAVHHDKMAFLIERMELQSIVLSKKIRFFVEDSITNFQLPYSYRVTHSKDLVPHLPPQKFENYRHHGNEIWYNNAMTPGSSYQECTMLESEACSNSLYFAMSIADHLNYYDLVAAVFGRAECNILSYKSNFKQLMKQIEEEDRIQRVI